MLLIAMLAAAADPVGFPERSPALIAACLADAAGHGAVSDDKNDAKYICSGTAARALWTFLEQAGVEGWKQDTPDEGQWLSREFPMGGCFKRIRTADGAAADSGLSCSIWVPRPTPAR